MSGVELCRRLSCQLNTKLKLFARSREALPRDLCVVGIHPHPRNRRPSRIGSRDITIEREPITSVGGDERSVEVHLRDGRIAKRNVATPMPAIAFAVADGVRAGNAAHQSLIFRP